MTIAIYLRRIFMENILSNQNDMECCVVNFFSAFLFFCTPQLKSHSKSILSLNLHVIESKIIDVIVIVGVLSVEYFACNYANSCADILGHILSYNFIKIHCCKFSPLKYCSFSLLPFTLSLSALPPLSPLLRCAQIYGTLKRSRGLAVDINLHPNMCVCVWVLLGTLKLFYVCKCVEL
jgi:hypothetical protein